MDLKLKQILNWFKIGNTMKKNLKKMKEIEVKIKVSFYDANYQKSNRI